MAQVITVMNMKGGVGKTTVAAHLGGMLQRYRFGSANGRQVLLIDYDPQFNLSQMFLPAKRYFAAERERRHSLAILQDDESDGDPYHIQVPESARPPSVSDLVVKTPARVDLIVSTLDLMYIALGQASTRADIFEQRFRGLVAEAKQIYDVIVIDCQPAGSILTKTALQNSDHVVIPVVESPFAARGIALMREFIDSHLHAGRQLHSHILFNNVSPDDGGKSAASIRADPRYANGCLTHELKRFKAFRDPVEGNGFVWVSGLPYSTRAFQNLQSVVGELVARTGI